MNQLRKNSGPSSLPLSVKSRRRFKKKCSTSPKLCRSPRRKLPRWYIKAIPVMDARCMILQESDTSVLFATITTSVKSVKPLVTILMLFLKIRHPRQAPVKIFVVLNDEEDSVEINGQRQPLNGLSELLENGLNFAQQFLNPNGQRFNFNSQQQTGMKEAPKQEAEKSEVK